MLYEKTKKSIDFEPLEDPEIIPTDKEGLMLEETAADDPELMALARANEFAIHQGEINMDMMNSLRARRDG